MVKNSHDEGLPLHSTGGGGEGNGGRGAGGGVGGAGPLDRVSPSAGGGHGASERRRRCASVEGSGTRSVEDASTTSVVACTSVAGAASTFLPSKREHSNAVA